jgi:hypothetical protein
VGGALYAHLTNRMPGHRASDFSLGRWFVTVAVSALLFSIGVVVIALAPQEGHIAGRYLLGAEVIGLLWYLLYLRPRLRDRKVGIYREIPSADTTGLVVSVAAEQSPST